MSTAADMLRARTEKLHELLSEMDRPPPVPPKDQRREPLVKAAIVDALPTPGAPNNLWAFLDAPTTQKDRHRRMDPRLSFRNRGAEAQSRRLSWDHAQPVLAPAEPERSADLSNYGHHDAIKSQTVTMKPRHGKVMFSQDDSGILTPPPSQAHQSFEEQLNEFPMPQRHSIFDRDRPPPAPRFSRFPDSMKTEEVTSVPFKASAPSKRKPAPLNLNSRTAKPSQWQVRRPDTSAEPFTPVEIYTPIDDEPNTAAIRIMHETDSMAMDNAELFADEDEEKLSFLINTAANRQVNPRPATTRMRGSMRPAPLKIRKGVRFEGQRTPGLMKPANSPASFARMVNFASPTASSLRTPLYTPLHKPSFAKKKVRFAHHVQSPRGRPVATPKTPSTPFAWGSLRARGIQFAKGLKSPAASRFKIPATPFARTTFDRKKERKNVQFTEEERVTSKGEDKLAAPLTPFNKAGFEVKKEVRFADDIASPTAERFEVPPTPYSHHAFSENKHTVRFANDIKSPTTSSFDVPPTPFNHGSFRVEPDSESKTVRFEEDTTSPTSSTFKVPPTPFNHTSFGMQEETDSRIVRFADNIASPTAGTFDVPPTPFNHTTFGQRDAEEARTVKFVEIEAALKISKLDAPPTPFNHTSFELRDVRFTEGTADAESSSFKAPLTPYNKDCFENQDTEPTDEKAEKEVTCAEPAEKSNTSAYNAPPTPFSKQSFSSVRFTEETDSPTVSSFDIPPTPYTKSSFNDGDDDEEGRESNKNDRFSPTPLDLSPVTPRAMHFTHPDIASDSPVVANDERSSGLDEIVSRVPVAQHTSTFKVHAQTQLSKPKPKKRVSIASQEAEGPSMQSMFPVRKESLGHDRQAHLPRRKDSLPQAVPARRPSQTVAYQQEASLQQTAFDEEAVGESTLRWLGMLPKPSYRVSDGTGAMNERNRILGSYFRGSGTGY